MARLLLGSLVVALVAVLVALALIDHINYMPQVRLNPATGTVQAVTVVGARPGDVVHEFDCDDARPNQPCAPPSLKVHMQRACHNRWPTAPLKPVGADPSRLVEAGTAQEWEVVPTRAAIFHQPWKNIKLMSINPADNFTSELICRRSSVERDGSINDVQASCHPGTFNYYDYQRLPACHAQADIQPVYKYWVN